jgi:phosphoesterase RecJ-like protein
LTNDDFVNADENASDVDHLSNELRSIEGVRAAALFRETPEGVVRVSLRSRGEVDVAAVAQKFGGGGHRHASGCRYEDKSAQQQIIEEVVRAVREAEPPC